MTATTLDTRIANLLYCSSMRAVSGPTVQAPTRMLCTVRRDAEVLSLFATIINKLQALMEAEVPHIFEAVFEVTLDMITKNFEARCNLTLSFHSLGIDFGPRYASFWLSSDPAFTQSHRS